jgi:hypothetical protein
MGAGGGHYHYIERAEAVLMHSASGFAWVQTRCNPRSTFDFQIEEYGNGSITRSRCYPAAERNAELRKRGLRPVQDAGCILVGPRQVGLPNGAVCWR